MSRTTLLFGPPGTGKTTALLSEVSDALRRGVAPEKIGFFAFTRKAAREARARAVEQFGLKEDDLTWFRTLHSAAFKMLGLSSSDVMQDRHYEEFGKALGRYTFEHHYNEDVERVPPGGALGDLALGLYTRARSCCTSIENEWRRTDEGTFTLQEVEWFAQSLDNYKNTYHLLDFSDFLDEVHSTLDLDLMIIDEAQDLTLQQWRFARRIGRDAKRIIIAGDDDQAIFEWAGADVRTFLSFNARNIVLPVSYRLPKAVWAKSNDIAKRIRTRFPKEWTHRVGALGTVHEDKFLEHTALTEGGSWLLLARQRWQLNDLEQACRDQGVVYQRDHVWSNQMPDVRATVLYERIRRGELLNGIQVNQIARYIPGLAEVDRAGEYGWNDVKWPFQGMPDWMTALTGLAPTSREYIRRVRRNNESLVNPGRVVLSTIHGAKGGEADNVFLLRDLSLKVVNAMDRDMDQEMRVWYVATSRARENLFIEPPSTKWHIDI